MPPPGPPGGQAPGTCRARFLGGRWWGRCGGGAGGSVLVGIVLLLLAPVVLAASGKSIIGGFAALFLIILSFALFTPWLLVLLIKLLRPLLSILLGLPGVIAARGVLAALSRTQVAVAALMIAISATIGVSIMISSFRQSVEQWLADYLAADIFITQARANPEGIDPEIVNEIR